MKKRKVNPFFLLPSTAVLSTKTVYSLGKDFLETMDQLDDLHGEGAGLEYELERELDEATAGLHNYGWGKS